MGLTELAFWDMTIAEITRKIESYNRVTATRAKERAIYDYIHASLIVKGVSITLGAKESYPSIQEVYRELFKDEIQAEQEKVEARKTELSTLRFKLFAQSYNNKFSNKEVLPKE